MTTTALVFPGMGPTKPAELVPFLAADPFAAPLLRTARDVLGYPVLDRFGAATEDYAESAQVSFLIACLALAGRAREEHGVEPAVCVGPSFGQKAAIAYTGALPVAEAIGFTARLARLEADYFTREHTDVVTHSFVRTPAKRLKEVLFEMDGRGEWYQFSCVLDHDFYMLSMRESVSDWFAARIRSIGGLWLYSMRPPMHCSAFTGLRAEVDAEIVAGLPLADPVLPLLSDQDGRAVETAGQVRTMLLDGVDRAVRWPDVVRALRERGVRRVCVAGPDNLFGRVGVTVKNFEVLAMPPRTAGPKNTPAPQAGPSGRNPGDHVGSAI